MDALLQLLSASVIKRTDISLLFGPLSWKHLVASTEHMHERLISASFSSRKMKFLSPTRGGRNKYIYIYIYSFALTAL